MIRQIFKFSGWKRKQPKRQGGPYYFSTWKSYRIPFSPENEITLVEAQKLNTYYEAFYNDQYQLVSFRKYCNNSIEWTDLYWYWPNGKIKRREMTKTNSEIIDQSFDLHGKML